VYLNNRDIPELVRTFCTQDITNKDACAMVGPVASKYYMEHIPVGLQ